MTGRRIGAIVIAVALIAGALLLRRAVLDDDADASPTGPASTTEARAADATELVCVTELEAVCDTARAEHPELRVTVEDAGVTLDRLAALPEDTEAPLWLTIEPFPAMVDALREAARLDPLAGEAQDVAASQLAIAAQSGRADVLATSCAGAPLWRCIGDNAGNPWTDLGGEPAWNTVRPSLGVVDRQAVALASLAAAVAGYLGTPDVTRAAWEADPSFVAWFNRLAGAVPASTLSAGTPLATMAIRQSALDLAATTGAELAALGGDRFSVNYPEPSMWVEAVLAVPGGTSAPDGLAATLTTAATASSWDAPGGAQQSLPGASTMLALRALWQETT